MKLTLIDLIDLPDYQLIYFANYSEYHKPSFQYNTYFPGPSAATVVVIVAVVVVVVAVVVVVGSSSPHPEKI